MAGIVLVDTTGCHVLIVNIFVLGGLERTDHALKHGVTGAERALEELLPRLIFRVRHYELDLTSHITESLSEVTLARD